MSRRNKRKRKEFDVLLKKYNSLIGKLKEYDINNKNLEETLKELTNQEREVIPIKPFKDIDGRYIPYCDYGRHQQILGEEKEEVCIERECIHYRRLYIPKEFTLYKF